MTAIAENLARVEDAIDAACRNAGRPREEVALMAVSKTHPISCLLAAADAGHRLFGENRVQEFGAKSADLSTHSYGVELHGADLPSKQQLQIHLIGHLQSNKAARAAELFTSVDTLDSLKLAERLEDAAARSSRNLPVLIEIKLSHEPSKEGLAPESRELAILLERLPDLPHLALKGLMTVAPIDPDIEIARACFRQLRMLRDTLAQRHPRLAFAELSMGMSGDYGVAIEEGSTQVRLGTAIFGERPRVIAAE